MHSMCLMLFQCFHAIANATLVSKHPSTIMIEQHATNSKKLEMEAKHDLEIKRIKNERELQVGKNQINVYNVISMPSLFQAL